MNANEQLFTRYNACDCTADDLYDTMRLRGFTEGQTDVMLREFNATQNPYNSMETIAGLLGQQPTKKAE